MKCRHGYPYTQDCSWCAANRDEQAWKRRARKMDAWTTFLLAGTAVVMILALASSIYNCDQHRKRIPVVNTMRVVR